MDGEKLCLYLAFLGALGGFILLAVSLPTEYMVEAQLVDGEGEVVGAVNFGILRGSKSLDEGTGSGEVYSFKVNDEYGDPIHPLITYTNILVTSFAAISALLAAILSLVNIVKNVPFASPFGAVGLFFYNILGAFLAALTVTMFTTVVFGTLKGDVTGPDESALGYSSTDATLGYSFWLLMAAITVLGLNCGTIILAQTFNAPERDDDKEGTPELMRSAKVEEESI